jgi:BCCT family betaine/carnitine transporter
MRTEDPTETSHNVDWFIFIGTAVLVAAVCLPLILFPEEGARVVSETFEFITTYFGFAYVWSATAGIAFLLWLALGRYGRVRLGPDGCKPEFSTFSWGSMLFCGGMGATVLYWGTIEWVYYYQSPPFGETPGSAAALQWAISYPIFHWGVTGWMYNCIPAVAIAYAYHVRNIPRLRISTACRAVLGARADGPLGRLIDLFFMVGLVGGSATGIGFTTPLITASVSRFAAIPEGLTMTVITVFLGTSVFAVSVYLGLDRGIRRLSNFNVVLALAFLLFVLLAGPTLFILKASTDALGFMIQNFLRMNTWTDPLENSGFVANWTIFYWAWWISLGPYMGIFISKISRGRTIREMVFGVVGFGALGCTLFFSVLGNYALHLELSDLVPVIDTLNAQSASAAIVTVLTTLPSGRWLLPLFALMCLIFMATTYQSASYTLSACATRRLPADRHPARWHRVFWALSLGCR